MKGAVAEVYDELKEKAEEVGLNITVKTNKKNQWYKIREEEVKY